MHVSAAQQCVDITQCICTYCLDLPDPVQSMTTPPFVLVSPEGAPHCADTHLGVVSVRANAFPQKQRFRLSNYCTAAKDFWCLIESVVQRQVILK